MFREFLAPVPGHRFVQLSRQLLRRLDERGYDRQSFLTGRLRRHYVTRMTFN